MDYENEVKNQQGQLEIEEKKILLMHKNPKLARKKFGRMDYVEERQIRKRAKREALLKFRTIERKYRTIDNKNMKYIHKKMLSEMDMRLDYKVIKAKLEAKMRREEMREIVKTRELVKQRLIKEMKAQRIMH